MPRARKSLQSTTRRSAQMAKRNSSKTNHTSTPPSDAPMMDAPYLLNEAYYSAAVNGAIDIKDEPIGDPFDDHMLPPTFAYVNAQFDKIRKQQETILQHNATISLQIQTIAQKMDAIHTQNATILRMLAEQKQRDGCGNKSVLSDPKFNCPTFPMTDIIELIRLSENLRSPKYMEQVVVRLRDTKKLICNGDLRKSTKNILEHMISYDILIQYTWTGRTSIDATDRMKLSFVGLQTIIECVANVLQCKYEVAVLQIKRFMKRVPQNYVRRNEKC